jgi:hypothetical protein
MALGIGLRSYHYLRNPSMWHDEAALVLNVLGKSFGELLGPLYFAEAAPPLFLWAEKAVTVLLGDSTFALRLLPFLASCASLLLTLPLARSMLSPRAVPWAVFLTASSDQLLWHASEAKPYSVDVFAASVLLWLYCRGRSKSMERLLVQYTILAPVVILLAFPGCFLYGGVLVALLPRVWRLCRAKIWLAYGALALTVIASFLLLLAGPIHAQRCEAMERCWLDCFPPYDNPARVPLWVVVSSLEILHYCTEPAGHVLGPLLPVGILCLWRRSRSVTVLLLVPIALALLASLGRAYPYGGTRVLAYAAPAVFLLLAEGIGVSLNWLRSHHQFAAAALCPILMLPLGLVAGHAVIPAGRADCAGASRYVQAHFRPGERITSNAWECLYYFRHAGVGFVPMTDLSSLAETRLWLIFSGVTLPERQQVPQQLAPGDWRVVRQREYSRTTVFLLERPGPRGGSP